PDGHALYRPGGLLGVVARLDLEASSVAGALLVERDALAALVGDRPAAARVTAALLVVGVLLAAELRLGPRADLAAGALGRGGRRRRWERQRGDQTRARQRQKTHTHGDFFSLVGGALVIDPIFDLVGEVQIVRSDFGQ